MGRVKEEARAEKRAWDFVSHFARTGRHVTTNTGGVRHANEYAAVLLLAHGLNSPEVKTRLNRLNTVARKKSEPKSFEGSMQGPFSAMTRLPSGETVISRVEQILHENKSLLTTSDIAMALVEAGATGTLPSVQKKINVSLGILELMGLASKHPFDSTQGARRPLRWTHRDYRGLGRAALEDNVHWWLLRQAGKESWITHHDVVKAHTPPSGVTFGKVGNPFGYAAVRTALGRLAESGLLERRNARAGTRMTPAYRLTELGERLVARANAGGYPEELRLAMLGVNWGKDVHS